MEGRGNGSLLWVSGLALLGGLGAGVGAAVGQTRWISVDFTTGAEKLRGKGSQVGLQ